MPATHSPKISPWLVLWLAFLLNFMAQAIHEAGHLVVYQLGGRGPTWGFTRLVQTDVPPKQPEAWVSITYSDGTSSWLRLKSNPTDPLEKLLAAVGGPLAALLTAIFGLVLAFRARQPHWQLLGLVLTLTVSFVAGAYYLRSPMRTGGDEAQVATLLGIPRLLLEIPLGLAFLSCLTLGLRQLPTGRTRLGWLGLVILASMGGGILMMQADPIITTQIDLGNSFFQPVLGFSLPVLVFYALVFLAIWLTLVKWQSISRNTEHATR